MLGLNLPPGVDMVAYADDVALVASSRSVPELEAAVRRAVDGISSWMRERGLKLAPQKTDAVMLMKRRYDEVPNITVDGHDVLPSCAIKYLGVRLDANRHFTGHVEEAVGRAESAALAVARLMPNIGGPSLSKRKMLMSMATSRLLYATPVWGGDPSMPAKMKIAMERLNRLVALRLVRAYRTVSGDAATFLAGAIPLDLMASERAELWAVRREGLSDEDYALREQEARARTLASWQERWSHDNGRAFWTKSLLPSVPRWLRSGGCGRLTFHLTQALTGHGASGRTSLRSGRRRPPTAGGARPSLTTPHTRYSRVAGSPPKGGSSTDC